LTFWNRNHTKDCCSESKFTYIFWVLYF